MRDDATPTPHPDVRWKRTGTTGVLLNLATGDYFELDPHALAIWRRLDGRTTVRAIVAALARSYGARPSIVARDVSAFLALLVRRKLVVAQPVRRPRTSAP